MRETAGQGLCNDDRMTNQSRFDRLLLEGGSQPTEGWDFSWHNGRATASATCAVIVISGAGINSYRGSAAFRLSLVVPNKSSHLIEVVTGVYLDGDATAPIGSRYLPLPQFALLSKGSLVKCT